MNVYGSIDMMEVTAEDHVFSVATHPNTSLLAVGSITGCVSCYSPCEEKERELRQTFSVTQHTKACRALCFSPKGDKLYSVSKDRHLLSINSTTGHISQSVDLVIKSPVNVMLFLSSRLVCGHDNGIVSVYETEGLSCLGSLELTEKNEYVSGICHTPSERQVIVTTGEGQVALIDTRELVVKKKYYSKSEILSVCSIPGEKKVVTGDTEGRLHFLSWTDTPLQAYAHMTCVTDTSVDSCVVLTGEELLCVGCGDGVVRIVSILTRQVTGVIGRKQKLQIENLCISEPLDMLCCSSGSKVLLWRISDIVTGVEKIEKKRNCKETESTECSKRVKTQETRELGETSQSSVVKGLCKRKRQKKQQVQSRSDRAQFFDGLL